MKELLTKIVPGRSPSNVVVSSISFLIMSTLDTNANDRMVACSTSSSLQMTIHELFYVFALVKARIECNVSSSKVIFRKERALLLSKSTLFLKSLYLKICRWSNERVSVLFSLKAASVLIAPTRLFIAFVTYRRNIGWGRDGVRPRRRLFECLPTGEVGGLRRVCTFPWGCSGGECF